MVQNAKSIDRFGKDADEESFFQLFNEALRPLDEELYKDLPEEYLSLHIVGLPRSGTTLLTQCLAAGLEIGYISNLVANFWRAPLTGIRFARKLAGNYRPSSFQSSYGRTGGIHDPHEFGYFWKELLGYNDMLEPQSLDEKCIDWTHVRRVITNVCHEFASPVLFKSFLLQWHIPEFTRALPRTCFIRIRRDPIETAASILRMRQHYFGCKESWISMKPKEFNILKDRPYWEQVAGQAYFLEASLNRNLANVNPRQMIEFSLPDLLRDPDKILRRVQRFLEDNQTYVDLISSAQLPQFRARKSTIDSADYERIKRAYSEFESSQGD